MSDYLEKYRQEWLDTNACMNTSLEEYAISKMGPEIERLQREIVSYQQTILDEYFKREALKQQVEELERWQEFVRMNSKDAAYMADDYILEDKTSSGEGSSNE